MSGEALLHLPQRGGRAARAPQYDVLIIGGGYAGVTAAIHLLRQSPVSPRLAIVEPRVRLGRGVAYDTRLSCHLLNTRAKHMSLRPDDEQHYTRWAQARAEAKGLVPGVDENSFTPRGWFGDYVGQELNVAVNYTGTDFTHLRHAALYCEKVERGLWRVGLSDGRCIAAKLVILALGNAPRRTGGFPGLRSPDARVLHAWDLQSRPPHPEADVLIVGTGLSMVDALLTLERQRHQGMIHTVSRHGLLPQAHSYNHGRGEPLTSTGLRALTRELRESVKEAGRTGHPWQWRMDAARHQAQALWRGLTLTERQRFLRHARAYWDSHRHRIAPEIALQLQAFKESGRLVIHRGKVGEIRATTDSLEVSLREAGGTSTLHTVQRVISSLGFELDPRRSDAPLLRNLLRTGVARPGIAGLGLRTDELGRLQSSGGWTWSALFALGSLRAGELWETTAAHEIQQQAMVLAEHLARRPVWYPISV